MNVKLPLVLGKFCSKLSDAGVTHPLTAVGTQFPGIGAAAPQV